MVDYADIGKRIRACRLAKGMTQEQLANRSALWSRTSAISRRATQCLA